MEQTKYWDQETFRETFELNDNNAAKKCDTIGNHFLVPNYLTHSHYSQSMDLFCLELAPAGLESIRKGPEERKRLAEMEKLQKHNNS